MPMITYLGIPMMVGRTIRVLRNPDGAKHPDGDRPLAPGDEIEFHDAMNGQYYWCNRKCRPMQSISVEDVERV